VLVVGEGALSHGALARRLAAALAGLPDVETRLHVVGAPRRLERVMVAHVPGTRDLDLQPLRWRLRYSLRARALLERDAGWADVALVNTQSCALLARDVMARVPTVLSVDVTGRQFADLRYWRPATRFGGLAEAPLERLERRAYEGARHVVAWTEWTAGSLRADYRVPEDRVSVLHFGVDIGAAPAPRAPAGGRPLRILFVANFVRRKGLDLLLDAVRAMDHAAEIDVVTGDDVEPRPGVRVHRGLQPGSDGHRELLGAADVFALPTRADAAPWAVVEALAAGLPVVASDVGAIEELVGEAGLLHAPEDVRGLARTLDELAAQPELRTTLARRARRRAEERFDTRRQVVTLGERLRAASYSA
jgi:glycosyltransferase involved in cell wall biosynthesis